VICWWTGFPTEKKTAKELPLFGFRKPTMDYATTDKGNKERGAENRLFSAVDPRIAEFFPPCWRQEKVWGPQEATIRPRK